MLRKVGVCLLLAVVLGGCEDVYTPKPKGYFRIAMPQKVYQQFDTDCPYSFEFPTYSLIHRDRSANSNDCWYNIDFPLFRARLHLSYVPLENNLRNHVEAVRGLAYKHTIKADAINEELTYDPDHQKYGIFYDIKGNAASSVQFFITDSTNHFMRGALYFNHSPNKDSIAPVVSFIKEDINHLIESLRWK